MNKFFKDFELDSIITTIDEDAILTDYWYYTGLKNRTIIINDTITSDIMERVVLPLIKMEQDSKEPITIYINTNGGSVWDGLVLLNILDKITCPVRIEVLGYALSMGIYILMAGYSNPNVTKYCHDFSIGLIHAGSLELGGDARKVKQIQKFNEKIEDKIKNFVLTHSKITEEEYEKHDSEEWYMTAEEMLELGIVDAII